MGKLLLDRFLNTIVCFVQTPSFTIAHINHSEEFFFYIALYHLIGFWSLETTVTIFSSERIAYFLTETTKTSRSFKDGVAMRARSSTFQQYFLLSACFIETFNSIIKSQAVKKGYDHDFKVTGLVLWRYESARLYIKIPMRVDSSRHMLELWAILSSTPTMIYAD